MFKVHCKSHEGEKCYKCELCPYASMSQRHLETHMLIHTDEKPFHCKLCDQVNFFQYIPPIFMAFVYLTGYIAKL